MGSGNQLLHMTRIEWAIDESLLGLGLEHPHAVFRANPYQIQTNGFTPTDPSMNPLDIARIFVDNVLSTQSAQGLSYKIRKDSYTDSKNTGITHVYYVRQLVNGLEVTGNGDMNINIKDGVVLSYRTLVCLLP